MKSRCSGTSPLVSLSNMTSLNTASSSGSLCCAASRRLPHYPCLRCKRQYTLGGSSVKLHLEADVFAAAVIQTNDRIIELRLLRRVKPGHSAPALVQQLLCNLLGQLLFLAGKELVVFPQAKGAVLVRAVEVALTDVDRRSTTRTFADFLLARAKRWVSASERKG